MTNSLAQETPLSGLKVLEIAGLAPVPFAGTRASPSVLFTGGFAGVVD